MIKWPNKVVLLGYFIKHRGLYFWRVHNHTVWFQTRLGKNLLQSVVYIYTIIRAYFEGHQNRHLYQKNVQVCTTLIFGKQIKLPNQFGNIHADSTFRYYWFEVKFWVNYDKVMQDIRWNYMWWSLPCHFFTFRRRWMMHSGLKSDFWLVMNFWKFFSLYKIKYISLGKP